MEGPRPDQLKLIRVALTGGVLAFGMVAFLMTQREGRAPPTPEVATLLQLMFGIVALGGFAGIVLLRSIAARAQDNVRRSALVVVAWALGEAPALVGGVDYFITGDPLTYIVGVVILLVGFILVPVPEQAGAQ